jgi:DNA-binding transcriptional LysR family regulator
MSSNRGSAGNARALHGYNCPSAEIVSNCSRDITERHPFSIVSISFMLYHRFMNRIHLRQVDLNLLVVLDRLLAERSVTRTAHGLGKTQSAVSHALGRLRSLFGDDLLVREGREMVPTRRAEALEGPVRGILTDIERVLEKPGSTFDPTRLERRFTVVATDLAEVVVLPALLARLRDKSSGVEVVVVGASDDVARRMGRGGGYDLALGFGLESDAALVAEQLFTEHLVCVVAGDHPRLADRSSVTMDELRAEDHILITPEGKPGDPVDAALRELGLSRRIVLRVPHAATAALIAARTDLVLTLPSRLARHLEPMASVRVLEAPDGVPTFGFGFAYHATHRADPAHAWFRAVIAEIANGA